ncbi:MAG: carbohydrate kinase, partial [Pseudodesulfovibrio sp.]
MPGRIAIGLGEILWDVLPNRRTLGGAPANFAYQVNALGGTGIPLSRVGDDAPGREALAELAARGVSTAHISVDPVHPTGTVLAELDANGVAAYTFPDDVAWDFLAPTEADLALAARADAICFGTLAQRSPVAKKGVLDVVRAAARALRIYDANLRQNFWDSGRIRASLRLADVLKINDAELAVFTDIFCLPRDARRALDVLLHRYGLKLAVLTRGAAGSLILAPGETSDLPGRKTRVADTIGAGDAFTAALALAWLHGWKTADLHRYAADVAAE